MPTDIHFRGGHVITVRESIDELNNIIENAGNKPAPVVDYYGARSFVNWSNVLYTQDRSELPDPSTGPGIE